MTDKEKIEQLEHRVRSLEKNLNETLKQLNRFADLMLKLSETLLNGTQTGYPWK